MKNKVRIEQLEAQMEQLRKWVIEIDKEVFPKCTLEGNDAPPCTPLNDPSKTAIPVSIEDLKKMAVCFHEWAYRPVDDKEADEQTSENLEKQMRYFLKKYLP